MCMYILIDFTYIKPINQLFNDINLLKKNVKK